MDQYNIVRDPILTLGKFSGFIQQKNLYWSGSGNLLDPDGKIIEVSIKAYIKLAQFRPIFLWVIRILGENDINMCSENEGILYS